MQTGRPLFATMWKNFNMVYGNGSLANVGATIGGKVEANIRLGATNPTLGFTNGCAIRMSYSLNHSGVFITNASGRLALAATGADTSSGFGTCANFSYSVSETQITRARRRVQLSSAA